jgi:hypothetical protein
MRCLAAAALRSVRVIVSAGPQGATVLQIDEVDRLAGALAGVRRTVAGGLAQWRYHGRLVARQLDDANLVIRADFDYRDQLLRQFPDTFSAPAPVRQAHDGRR